MAERDVSPPGRPAHVVAVCNLKGGTGKSTLSVNLACALAELGASVVLVDNDEQGSAVTWAAQGRLPVRCVHLPLARAEGFAAWVRDLQALRAEHDIALVDFPAGLAPALAVTLLMASLILVPCAPNGLEVAATRRMLRHVDRARAERRDDPPPVAIVPSRVVEAERTPADVRDWLVLLGEELAPAVAVDGAYDHAFVAGLWAGACRPGSKAHAEMTALARFAWARLAARGPVSWPPPSRRASIAAAAAVEAAPATAADRSSPPPPAVAAPGPAAFGRAGAPRRAPTLARSDAAVGWASPPDPKVIYFDEVATPTRRAGPSALPLLRWAARLLAGRGASAGGA